MIDLEEKKIPVDWNKVTGVGRSLIRHMLNYQPNLYRQMIEAKELNDHVQNVEEQVAQYIDQAQKAKMDSGTMWEVIRDTWISLPDVENPEQESLIPEE